MKKSQRKLGQYLCKKWYVLAIFCMVLMGASFSMFSSSVSALTTVPTKTNFQGRLTNSSGNIMADGLYNMKFRLFTVSSGGSDVWNETRETTNRVQVTNGLFSVRLGDVTPIPASLFASGGLYFEVELPTPGTATCSTAACASFTEGPMTPRNQLATSAYAYNSETLDGLDSASFARTDANNLLLGTNTINVASTNAFDVQNGSAVSVFKVDTSASVVTIAADTVLAAGKSLTITGSGSRPGSPTPGMLYYDTTTNQLLQWNGSKWVSDRSTATKIIAPSNASQAVKDAADVLLTGTADQTLINTALTAAAGGKVYIAEGTVTITGNITVPNNTTLAGAGSGTIVTYPNNMANATYLAITNTDTSTGTGVIVQDLLIDGNKANQTTGSFYGIRLNSMGGGSGASARTGAKIANVTIKNIYGAFGPGVYLNASSNNVITGNTFQNSTTGIYVFNGANNTLNDNIIQGNVTGIVVNGTAASTVTSVTASGNTLEGNGQGISVQTANNTITGNTIVSSTNAGMSVSGINNTITGNTVSSNGTYGINLSLNGDSNVVSGNTVSGNTSIGIYLSQVSNNLVASNRLHDNTGSSTNSSIFVQTSGSANTITGNHITDTAGTGFAIQITAGVSSTYLSNNTYSGTGAASISDAGTGTIYGGQVNSSGNYVVQPAGTVELMSNTNVTGTLNISSNVDSNGSLTIGTANQFVIDTAGVVTAGTWQSSTQIQDAYISNTLTASIFQGSGTTTDAVDLATAEVAGTLTIGRGGTGATTLTSGGVLYGNGTGAIQATAAGTSSQCLIGGAAPVWSTCNLQSAYTVSTGSTTPEIKLDTTRGAFDIQDADSTIGASLLNIKTSSAAATLLSVGNTGVTTFQNSSDSADAFTISRAASGGSLFIADTTNSRVRIGSATADATGVVLVLDTKNDATDPTGVDGAMYYNSNKHAFRCYQGGEWRSCIGGLAASNTASQSIAGVTATDWTKQYTIPANNCVPGRVYKISARGTFTTGLTGGNLTVQIYAGATVLMTSGAVAIQGSQTNRQWIVDASIVCQTAGGSGTVEAAGTFERFTSATASAVAEMANATPGSAITLDTTASQVVKLRSTATQAGTTVVVRQIIIESLGP